MPTTEFVTAPLKPDIEIGDDKNEGAKTLKELADKQIKVDGIRHIHFGTQIEHADVLEEVVHWDNLDKHKEFQATEEYGPFVQKFLSLSTAPQPTIIHTDMEPEGAIDKALAAPITEIAKFFFGGDAPDGYIEGVLKLEKAMTGAKTEGYYGLAIGLIHEEQEKDGHKGQAALLAIGWSSVDAHMKFRETQMFKDNIGHLRNGVKTSDVHHTAFFKVEE